MFCGNGELADRVLRFVKWPVLVLLAGAAWSQEPKFATRAREVVVPVSVITKGGKPVESLSAEDFVVLNDGQPQKVRMIERDSGALPVEAVIVVEANEVSEAALAKIRKTASLISTYISNDMDTGVPSLAAVVTVADEVNVAQGFTADPYLLRDAFNKLKPKGDAARLVDGVSLGCDLLAARKPAARRVIVLIGESRDVGSKAKFADVVVKAQRDDVVIYTVSYSAYTTPFTQKASERQVADIPGVYDPSQHGGINLLAVPMALAQLAKVNVAEAFARSTGGAHEKFTTLRGLEMQLTTIGTEVHNRYTLTFVPPKQQAGYHQLTVSVRKPGNWRVHARAGYWSVPE